MRRNYLPLKVLWQPSGDGVSACISAIRPNIERIFFGIGIRWFYGDFRNARKGNGGQDGEIWDAVTGFYWDYPVKGDLDLQDVQSHEKKFVFCFQCLRTTMNATAPRPINAINAP